jgi:hypothetical protein
MPIGPIGQSPIDRTPDASDTAGSPNAQANAQTKETFQAPSVSPQAEAPTAAPTPAKLATQLVQDARASGNTGSLAAPLGDLVKAVTSQMGMPELPQEQRQNLAAKLADDPVVKNLIG